MKEQMKATSFWWKWKIIYDLKLIAWQLASTRNSEKHHESEESKKKSVQELSLNASEILIDQWVQTEQESENDELKEMFTKEDENWYETILQEIKNLNIKRNENLMTCRWSH